MGSRVVAARDIEDLVCPLKRPKRASHAHELRLRDIVDAVVVCVEAIGFNCQIERVDRFG